jgi:hypothetical protein
MKKHARALGYAPRRRFCASTARNQHEAPMAALDHNKPEEVMVEEPASTAVRQPEKKPAPKRNFYRPELPTLAEVLAQLRASQDNGRGEIPPSAGLRTAEEERQNPAWLRPDPLRLKFSRFRPCKYTGPPASFRRLQNRNRPRRQLPACWCPNAHPPPGLFLPALGPITLGGSPFRSPPVIPPDQ